MTDDHWASIFGGYPKPLHRFRANSTGVPRSKWGAGDPTPNPPPWNCHRRHIIFRSSTRQWYRGRIEKAVLSDRLSWGRPVVIKRWMQSITANQLTGRQPLNFAAPRYDRMSTWRWGQTFEADASRDRLRPNLWRPGQSRDRRSGDEAEPKRFALRPRFCSPERCGLAALTSPMSAQQNLEGSRRVSWILARSRHVPAKSAASRNDRMSMCPAGKRGEDGKGRGREGRGLSRDQWSVTVSPDWLN